MIGEANARFSSVSSVVNPLPAVAPVDREAGNLHGRKVVIGIFSLGLDGGAGVLFRFDLAANERHIADDASGLIASESTVGLGEILIVVWARLPPQKVLQRDEGGVAEREPGEGVTGLDLSYLETEFVVSHVSA